MEEHRVLWNNRNTLSKTVKTDCINGVSTQVDAARVGLEKPLIKQVLRGGEMKMIESRKHL